MMTEMNSIFEQVLRESHLTEAKQLCSGIFWIISDNYDLSEHKLLMFEIPCDVNGTPDNPNSLGLNAKSGITYNHKKTWENEIKTNSEHRPYNKRDYDYYPRGRIQIANNKAIIYINPHINQPLFIDEIKQKFGLSPYNISEVEVKIDGSVHYYCFLDRI
jgi:hypothetical protein